MGSAVLRAAHVREDAPPWVLEDNLSERLLDRRSLEEVRAEIARWTPDVRAAFRLAHAVRGRLAEDTAVEGLAVSRHDYVLLGAGLDTFAWRHPEAGRFRIWEIDHPATQRWKRRALAERRLGEPANVRFVPVDLAAVSLGTLETPITATWNWLGVTMYLERSVTEQVLKDIARRCGGTQEAVLSSPPRSATRGLDTCLRRPSLTGLPRRPSNTAISVCLWRTCYLTGRS